MFINIIKFYIVLAWRLDIQHKLYGWFSANICGVKMPKINLRGETFQVCPDADSHFTDLASNLELLQSSGNYTDINIHCKDKIVLSVHRQSISKFSKILKQIFSSHCDCLTFMPIVFDLLLPGKIASFSMLILVSPNQGSFS